MGGNLPDGDVDEARADLAWGEVYGTGKETAELAGRIADETGPEGPFLAGMDALVAAVGREVGAPVVSNERDLTHEGTREVVDVEPYRD